MRKNYLWHTIYFLYLFSFLQRSKICENLAESQAAPSQRTWTFQVTQDTSTIRKVSSTQSISGGVLPWEVPTQKTAGNPHSCCWGKLRVGRKQRSCTYGMFSTNFKCAKLQFYLNMIAHRERWEKLLWPKDKCTVKSMTKVRRNPRDCSNLFNLSSQYRRSYKTFSAVLWLFDCRYFVLCYFILTPSKCCARNSQWKESWYQVFFRMTTSLPISISPITQHSHSCKLTHLYQLKLNLRLLGIHAPINTRLLAYIKTEL